jgi:hypothetical protein
MLGDMPCFLADERLVSALEGLDMDSVEMFLAHTVRLEQEAALRFEKLADAMQTAGNGGVAQLFKSLAHFSRLHLADAKARSEFREVPELGCHLGSMVARHFGVKNECF